MSTSTAELDSLRRSAKVINVLAWGVVALIMAYGTPIVFHYLTGHGVPAETAWMLSIATDGALAVGLVATPVLAQHGIKAGWVGALRWIAGLATWALNTSDSWSHEGGPDIAGVISHSWGPLLMFAAVEGAAYFSRKIAEVIRNKEAEATKRVDDLAEFRTRAEDADRKRAAAEAALRAEERTRAEAEERAEAEAAGRKRAEERAAVEAEVRAEESRESEAEIARLIRHSEDVQASARDARAQAAEQSELAARISGQLDEARLMAERAIAEKMNAEQHISALTDAHTAVAQELERVRQSYARLQSRAENQGRQQAEISAPPKRKKTPALPPALPVDVPPVEGVASGTVARVISAYRNNPGGTQKAIAAAAGTTDRTVRTVLSNIPADHPALAIESAATTKES
ncbi:hypothetical protein OHA01_26475 [Micromonospora zamorensis]|uniref:hypothetical protein n=1 Tax=Micromonospora zamorensis TaxID=709883 RepID=UPI00352B1504|nr:hypothetical protein OG423_14000 [Micromonospora zamorensis]WTE86069.1 hypothetical protein OHA01_26475 [Micromonospora zamorensis]